MTLRINYLKIFELIFSLVDNSEALSQTSLNSLIQFYLTISIVSLCIAVFLQVVNVPNLY